MAKETKVMQKLGSWAFVVGVVISVVAGFFPLSAAITSVLIILGLVVGTLNVTAKETMPFLFATVALVIVSSFGGSLLSNVAVVGSFLGRLFSAIVIFVVPASVIVAVKTIYALAVNE